jgi:hypothetical protein
MWRKLSQTCIVERVEPCVEFWTKSFGFKTLIAIPEGDKLAFATVARDKVELSYRSRSSLIADVEALADVSLQDASILTIEVDSVDEIVSKLDGLDAIIPRRRTFYGNNEVIIRGPSGQIVIFTAPGDQPTMTLQVPRFAKPN